MLENANQGIDTIRTSFSLALGSSFENLTLIGSGAIDGVGNDFDNTIIGNNNANILTGEAGNDILDGGAGTDTMVGGLGNDTDLALSLTFDNFNISNS